MPMNETCKLTSIAEKLLSAFIIYITLWLVLPGDSNAQSDQYTSDYVSVNSLNYYYEIHGQQSQRKPLLLFHGGLGSFDMFDPILPILTKNRKVIGVDLHGHGRTALGDRAISYIDMGNDMAAILKKLGYKQVDVMGYSMGSGVALRLAAQHPELVHKLVLVSGSFSRDGFYPDILQQQAQIGSEMAEMMKGTPMYQSYQVLAPKPQDFPRLLDQISKLMAKPFDWSEEVKKLNMPVMLIYGDSDMFRPEHIVDFYQLLGGGLRDAGWQREHMSQNRLAILPNLTHYEIFMAPQMVETSLSFLNGKTGPKSWSEQLKDAKK